MRAAERIVLRIDPVREIRNVNPVPLKNDRGPAFGRAPVVRTENQSFFFSVFFSHLPVRDSPGLALGPLCTMRLPFNGTFQTINI